MLGLVNGFVQSMMQLVGPAQNRVVDSFLGSLSVLVSILLICKNECDVYRKCESSMILRYLWLIVIQKGSVKHVYHLGSLRCGGVLARSHIEKQSHYDQICRNGWWNIMSFSKSQSCSGIHPLQQFWGDGPLSFWGWVGIYKGFEEGAGSRKQLVG